MSLNINFFFHIEMSQIHKTSNNKNTFEYKNIFKSNNSSGHWNFSL